MRKKDLLLALALLEERIKQNAQFAGLMETHLYDLRLDTEKLRTKIEKEWR